MKPAADATGVLVAGSANADFVVRASRIPAPGETVLGREFTVFPGGKGANQAVACAVAGGANTQMLVALGNDDPGAMLEASLRDAGVRLHVVRSALATGSAFICVSDAGENAITVAPGANAALRPEDLPILTDVGYLVLQLETPLDAVLGFAEAAKKAGVKVVLNASPAASLPAALIAALDVLVVNESELAALAGDRDDLAGAMARLGLPLVVVTLGAAGCCALQNGRFLRVAAVEIEPVDTTGAGDTFCGALVAALAEGRSLSGALTFAGAAAAIACTRAGAQTGIPSRAEVLEFMASRGVVEAESADEPPRH